MLRLGLIAPEWSLERILSVSAEYKDNIKFSTFKFNSIKEIPKIIEAEKGHIHRWLFSGPLPYYISKYYLHKDEDLFYCRITEAGLMKSLLEVAYDHKSFLQKISLDFMEEIADMNMIISEINIPRSDVFISCYSVPLEEDEIFEFHFKLWKDKKTCCAITTIPSVYNRLKESGVPVYNIKVSSMEIRLTIELLLEKERSMYFKNTQLGLLAIEISNYESVAEKAMTPYKMQLLELKINNLLLNYCEQIDGYMVPKGNGRYEIFGSRGKIESNIPLLSADMDKISVIIEAKLVAGIGFGDTVFIAQINSNKALNLARKKSGIIILDGDGNVIEQANANDRISYSISSDNAELNRLLQIANVGIRTYRKMSALSEHFDGNSFSALTIAQHMGVTDRNLRRIISGLLKAGLIVCVGEESSGERGRPAKIYKFSNISK